MAKTYINLALFTIFAFCTTPAFASQDQTLHTQKTEQTTPQEEQQCSDLVAVNKDLQKVVIVATLVGLSWALLYTYKKLVNANTHIAELEGIRLAYDLILYTE